MISDWNDAYQNGAYIPEAETFLPKWEAAAAKFRELHSPRKIRYGDHPRQIIDLFVPENPKGLAVFIHGGYWHSMDRSQWSHLAAGALKRGRAVALPGYVLCPEASIAEITTQIATAVDTAARHVDGPIHLTGHSAGGHLASRMACDDVDLACATRIHNIVSISGVHDLRPLLNTDMNVDLKLTHRSAIAESPVFNSPRADTNLTCWVGADERPEFLRQNNLLANIWTGCGANTRVVQEMGHNHFTVVDGLMHPDSPLINAVLDAHQGI